MKTEPTKAALRVLEKMLELHATRGSASLQDLAEALGVTKHAIHLQVIKLGAARLVAKDREGVWKPTARGAETINGRTCTAGMAGGCELADVRKLVPCEGKRR